MFNINHNIISKKAEELGINNFPWIDRDKDPCLTYDFIINNLNLLHLNCIAPMLREFPPGDLLIKSAYRSSILNEAIEADINEANPALVILAFGEPPVGVEMLLAAKSPSIVTSEVIIPPCCKNFEPVIPPFEDNINASLVEFIYHLISQIHQSNHLKQSQNHLLRPCCF